MQVQSESAGGVSDRAERPRVSLRSQLILSFLLINGLALVAAGIYIDWRLQQVVENEIGARLSTIALLAAEEASQSQILRLVPGDESSRTAQRLRERFSVYTGRAGVSRIVIADTDNRVYFDSRNELPIGAEYVRMRFDAAELATLAETGTAVASVLFFDNAGQPFKAAYASLDDAVIRVEGSASGLRAIRDVRRVLLTVGVTVLAGAALLAALIAYGLTRPLTRLTSAAQAVGQGEYETPLPRSGTTEIRVLSQTLEEMRSAIQKRHEQQQMMLAGVAHEIRNPLGGIELFAGLLKKNAGPEAKPQAAKILKEVQALKQIVNDFLEYARPVAPAQAPVALRAAVEEAIELSGPPDTIIWDVQVESGLRARFDPEHLRRICLNLFRNAIEAVRNRPDPRITVMASPEGGRILLSVRDNGPGIPNDQRERVFEPFFTTRSQGTGLGLALVRLLLRENGGQIMLRPEEPGCSFELQLPAARTIKSKSVQA